MPPLLTNINEVSLTPIQKFYAGSNIFITGGTGFLGLLLVEKLLRACPDLGNIYILIRGKKGKNAVTRIDEILDDCIFDRLKNVYPKYRNKVFGIEGDCTLPNLGISEQDRKLLITEISVVFHVAATVNFDEKLKTAVEINVKGTKDLLNLCKEILNLRAVVHVSTAFSNCAEDIIEEVFYPLPITSNKLIGLTEILNDDMLDKITPSLLGKFPNTYAFTKAVAEGIVQEEAKDLPAAVFRPSIVISTYKEPLVGWVNNMYGAVGVEAGAGLGVLRVLHCNPKVNANVVPADMCINALLAVPWEIDYQLQKSRNNNQPSNVSIFQYESSQENPIDWQTYMNLSSKNGLNTPPMNAVWYYTLALITSYRLFQLLAFFSHLLPAFLMDLFLFITGRKRRCFIISGTIPLCPATLPLFGALVTSIKFIKIYNKIHRFNCVISYFNTKNFHFKSTTVRDMISRMSPTDKILFFCDLKKLDWEDYFKSHFKGLRIYLLKDPLSSLPQAKRRWKRLYWCHQAVKIILLFICIRLVWILLIYFLNNFT